MVELHRLSRAASVISLSEVGCRGYKATNIASAGPVKVHTLMEAGLERPTCMGCLR